jgi:hypothetical protein
LKVTKKKGKENSIDAEGSGEDDDQPKMKKKKKVSTSHMFHDPSEPN